MRTYFGLSVVFLMSIQLSFSQSIELVVGQPEHNVLYDGYPNLIKIGWWSKPSNVEFVGEGMEVKKSDRKSYFELTPRGVKRAKLVAINPKTKDTVATQSFRIIPLPKPIVFLGTTREGEKLTNRAQLPISVRYGETVPLTGTFEVKEWEISFSNNNQMFTGTGNQLSTEAQSKIREAAEGTEIQLSVLYAGSGIPRKFTRVKFTL